MKLFSLLFVLTGITAAQLPPGNEAGVAMGHIHLNVKDLDAHRTFWVDLLGATPVKLGSMQVMKFPGALIFLRQAEPSGGTEGSAVNHIGFLVKDLDAALAKWKPA